MRSIDLNNVPAQQWQALIKGEMGRISCLLLWNGPVGGAVYGSWFGNRAPSRDNSQGFCDFGELLISA